MEKVSKDATLEEVLEEIRAENPGYWPNGLRKELYNGDSDDLEPIKAEDGSVIGFLGWQERGGKGYYSIGLLPGHRHKGLAKTLLPPYIASRNTRGLPVRATIDKDNKPSLALADKLGIKVNLT